MTDQATPPTSRGRGRRPAEDVRADTLRAVEDLLWSAGSIAVTYESVAKRAGVSKTTLYKWWPSKGALALDGYFHAVEETLAFHDTGDIRADLIDQLRHFAHITTATPAGKILTELVGQSQTDQELAAAYRARYSAERRRLAVERMQRAKDAGQIREEVDLQVLVDQLWGAVYHRLLIPDEPITDEFITALVNNLLDGVGSRASS